MTSNIIQTVIYLVQKMYVNSSLPQAQIRTTLRSDPYLLFPSDFFKKVFLYKSPHPSPYVYIVFSASCFKLTGSLTLTLGCFG